MNNIEQLHLSELKIKYLAIEPDIAVEESWETVSYLLPRQNLAPVMIRFGFGLGAAALFVIFGYSIAKTVGDAPADSVIYQVKNVLQKSAGTILKLPVATPTTIELNRIQTTPYLDQTLIPTAQPQLLKTVQPQQPTQLESQGSASATTPTPTQGTSIIVQPTKQAPSSDQKNVLPAETEKKSQVIKESQVKMSTKKNKKDSMKNDGKQKDKKLQPKRNSTKKDR